MLVPSPHAPWCVALRVTPTESQPCLCLNPQDIDASDLNIFGFYFIKRVQWFDIHLYMYMNP